VNITRSVNQWHHSNLFRNVERKSVNAAYIPRTWHTTHVSHCSHASYHNNRNSAQSLCVRTTQGGNSQKRRKPSFRRKEWTIST